MTMFNIIYTSKWDSNLILLDQPCQSEISYHKYPNSIILKQKKSIIKIAKRYKNLFIFETDFRGKLILKKEKKRLIYLFNSNSQIRLLYCHLDYSINAKEISMFKLENRIHFRKVIRLNKTFYSLNIKFDNKISISDINADNKLIAINKVIKSNLNSIKKLYRAYIGKNKKILKSTHRFIEPL